MRFRLLPLLFLASWASPSIGDTLLLRFDSNELHALSYYTEQFLFPCDLLVGLEGYLSVEIDQSSQAATLSFLDVTLGTTQAEPLGMSFGHPEGSFCNEFGDSIENTALASVMPGVDSLVAGIRSNENVYVFGPQLTGDRSFMIEFTLDASSSQPRLTGSSAFYGDDGPTYSLDALLVSVPEPSPGLLTAIAAIGGIKHRFRP